MHMNKNLNTFYLFLICISTSLKYKYFQIKWIESFFYIKFTSDKGQTDEQIQRKHKVCTKFYTLRS